MKVVDSLPESYSALKRIDLQKDKQTALFVNLAALALAVIAAVVGHFIVPFFTMFGFEVGDSAYVTLFDPEKGLVFYILRFAVMAAGYLLYVVLHEGVHAAVMRLFGSDKVKFGFTGLYAYAGSDRYFPKLPYIAVALAPVVVWGVVLGAICAVVPDSWFWPVYFIQIGNISGAAGDLFVTFSLLRYPTDVLIRDTGVAMTVYGKKE